MGKKSAATQFVKGIAPAVLPPETVKPSATMTLLEPRIMLDANLGWDVDASDLTVALDGIALAIDQQHGAFEDFLDSFESAMETAAGSYSIVLGDEHLSDTALYFDDIVNRLTAAADELADSADDMVTDILSGYASGTMRDDFRTALASAATGGTFTAGQITALNGIMNNGRLNDIFSSDTITAGTLTSSLMTLATDMEATLTAAGVTQVEARAALLGVTNTFIAAQLGSTTFELDLNDLANVDFTAGTAANSAHVAIALDGPAIDFAALFAAALPDATLPLDISFDAEAGTISFDILPTLEEDGTGNLTDIGLSVSNFDFGALLSLGGSVTASGDPMVIGLVEFTVGEIETAQFGLFLTGDVIDLGVNVDVTAPTLSAEFDDPALTFGVEARISEAGESSGTFAAIAADTAYDILAFGLDGSLDFASDIADSDVSDDGKVFAASLTVSSILNSTAVSGAVNRLTQFFADTRLGFDVDFSASVSDAQLRATLENAVESLLVMSSEDAVIFFQDIGLAMRAVMESAIFDTAIPFTDIELSQVTQYIGAFFDALAQSFVINAADLGFPGSSGLDFEINGELNALTGARLTSAQIDELQDVRLLNIVVPVRSSAAADATTTLVPVTIDLTANAVMLNAASTDAAVLNELASRLTAALSGYNLAATVVNGALRFTATNPGGDATIPLRTLSIVGATKRNGTVDDNYSLESVGFGDDLTTTVTDALGSGLATGAETLLNLKHAQTHDLAFGANFSTAVAGLDVLRFTVEMHGVTHYIDVEAPAAGWATGTIPNYTGIATSMQDAFDQLDLPLTVAGSASGLAFSAQAGTNFPISFGVESQFMAKAVTLEGMISYINSQISTSAAFAGSEFKLTEAGELMFVFPQVAATVDIDTSDSVSLLSTEGLGLGNLADLSLEARLTAALSASFSGAAGIDLIGLAADLVAASGAANAVEAHADAAGVRDALLSNVFFADLELAAELTGTATNVTGSASLGMVGIELGADDATQNWLALNTQIDVSLVGTDTTDGYNNHVTLLNIVEAMMTTDNGIEAGGFRALVGRYDIQGGIVTDGEGNAIDALGDVADFAGLQIVDADTYTVGADEELVEFYASFGDVKLNAGDIQGLNEGLVEGINISVSDIFYPVDTFDYALVGENQAALEAIDGLAALGEGDILDSMSAIANMLVVAGDTLKTRLPFLAMDIPLLNFSLMDSLDFARDFAAGLSEVRDNPEAALDQIEAMLEEVFGADTVTLTWDGAEKTIIFELAFKFLEDYSEELPFALDLKELVGSSLSDVLGETVADMVTGLVDVSGDGTMVFDPDLSMNFVFGIDLKPTLVEATVPATLTMPLSELGTVSDIIGAADGGSDLKIVWNDATTSIVESLFVDLSGATTLGDAVTLINDAVTATFGANVTFTFDPVTQQLTLSDSNADLIDNTGVSAMFGDVTAESAPGIGGDETIELDDAFAAFTAAQSFELVLGQDGSHPGESVVVSLAADAARTTATAFANALNAALEDLAISRQSLSDIAGPGLSIAVSQLVTAQVSGGAISLVATNFLATVGYTDRGFSVQGVDVSHDVSFTLIEMDGSNAARMLGFDGSGEPISGDATSEVLWEGTTIGAPRVYLDTDASGIRLDLTAGVAEGLNITLGIGPINVNVVDGHALLTSADGTGSAFIGLIINDIDGDTNDSQYNLSDIYDLARDSSRSFLELFALDVSIGVSVDLPLSDNVGLFDPAEHGISYQATLLETVAGSSLADFDLDDLSASFSGDIISLYEGGSIDLDNLEVSLPDLASLFSNFNYIAFLNDPRAVLNGLDMILDRMQTLFDDYLADISIPVIGEAIGAGVTFFNDFRYNVIEKIRVLAETPRDDGSYPTTVDLLTDAFNGLLNDLFTPGEDNVYIQADLVTDGAPEDAYLIGSLNFGAVIFDEMMNIAFDFGVPGLDIEVEDGSQIHMVLDYTVNLGFGVDRRGFYLLNDTDRDEIGIQFTADAGSFVGSANVLNILGLHADAVTMDDDGEVVEGSGTGAGTAQVTASLGAQLYGDTGLTIVSGEAGEDEIQRDMSGLTLVDGSGDELQFEKLVYISALDSGNLIQFSFDAGFDIQIALEANIIDPTTGNPILIGGLEVIPTVKTELWVAGGYTYGTGLHLDHLEFNNVRLDAGVLYDAIIAPVLEPIMDVFGPIIEYFEWLNEEPFSYAVQALSTAFPIFSMIQTIDDIYTFFEDLRASGGEIEFGDFSFLGSGGGEDDYASGNKKLADADSSSVKRDTTGSKTIDKQGTNPVGVYGNYISGVSIEIPMIRDPMNIMNLLLGKFDEVNLIQVNFNLFNIDTGRINVAEAILDAVGAPGWVEDIISSAFSAHFSLKFKAGFSAGYDLGGIVNFVNTLDPERLLDGIYIDSAPGSLITAEVTADVSLNIGIAGLDASVGAGVHISLNDPNGDGKLRIPELIALGEAAINAGDVFEALGIMFVGDANVYAHLSLWAGFTLPWPLPDLIWSSGDILGIDESITFGGNTIAARVVTDLSNGETAFLNVGARYGDSMSKIVEDGDDVVSVSGSAAGQFSVSASQAGQTLSGSFSEDPSAIVVPAGEGDNTVDLSGITDGTPTVVYAGKGTDTITLPGSGIHVIFAGEGNDTITAPAGSTGTYIIFGEKGADTIDIPGGNVLYFGDDDFGMRDLFLATFKAGGITDASIRTFFGIDGTGQPNPAGAANYTLNDQSVNLTTLLANVTVGTQLTAGKDIETVTLGTGHHVVVTGGGADVVQVNGTAGTGNLHFHLGSADDKLVVTGAATVFAEGGAGGDRIFVEATSSEVWGWGEAAGITGLIGTPEGRDIDTLAMRDGSDVLVGGSGTDALYGQLGDDVIQGGDGNDTGEGGLGKDLISGGTFVLTTKAGVALDITTFSAAAPSQTGVILATTDSADGNDSLGGGNGDDIIIGGGGNDTVLGGTGNDVVLGDFGRVGVSSNLIAETVVTEFDESDNAGTDNVQGNEGNDIIIVGGAVAGEIETVVDTLGSNVVIGDFGTASGTRLMEAVTKVDSFTSSKGSADSITTGRGNDMIIGGEGSDIVISGAGGDIILTDIGTIDILNSLITSVANVNSGDDEVSTSADDELIDIVIGGQGSDTISGGLNGLILLADNGTIELDPTALGLLRSYAPPPTGASEEDIAKDAETLLLIQQVAERLTSVSSATDGDDVVTLAGGTLIAALGGGSDSAENTATDGIVYVLGDDGTIEMKETGPELTSAVSGFGGDDSITNGSGDSLVIAGEGADTVVLAGGNNKVLGDLGTLTPTDIASTNDTIGGNDTITTGAGDDTIFGQAGDDLIDAGDGNNVVLGDNGSFDGTLLETNDDTGGDDDITTGSGDDRVFGGNGGDTIVAGEGENVILGDSGTFDGVTLISGLDEDGDDSITAGAGDDTIFGGDGDDTIDAGNGNNVILGDSGTFDGTDLISTLGDGGEDSVTSGTGADTIFGGNASDTIDAGDGDNTVLGDSGTFDGVTLVTVSDQGGADDITTGTGEDVIMGAEGGDTIAAGAGNDRVMGDFGTIVLTQPGQPGRMTSLVGEVPADDSIDAGDGDDIVIAGQGNDFVQTGYGDDVVAGDSAEIIFDNIVDMISIEMTDMDRGGDDTITAEGTDGDNIMLGQFGADSLIGGNDDDVMLGDLVTLTLLDPAAGFPNQSTADRINNIVSIRPDVGFDDTMTGGEGSDFQLGGMGADLLQGDEGDDILIGDNIIMVRTWTPLGGPAIFERTTLDTNFAFMTGGDDTIVGNDGADIMIGGLGPDLFVGDTQRDLIFSDAYAGIFNTVWPFGFGGETPRRNLITSNFAGPGPIDLVSEAQQNGSIGNRLDFTTKYTDIGSSDREGLSVLGILSSGSNLLAQLSAFLSHSRITHSVALMLLAGAGEDLLIAALRAELAANLASIGRTDLLAHEILIQTLLAKYLEKAGITKSETSQVEPVGQSARMPYQIAAE